MAMFARLQRRMVSSGGVRVPLRRMIGITYAANAMSGQAQATVPPAMTFRDVEVRAVKIGMIGSVEIARAN